MIQTASFGYWVRRRRRALDLTQAELARQVGCVVATIKKIEADARRPSKYLAVRLADSLAVPADERPAFLQVARAELPVDRLPLCASPIDGAPADAPRPSEPEPEARPAGPPPALHQLRAPVGDFVGRAAELARLCAALQTGAERAGGVAVVGVQGMGGVGKTELAHAAAHRVRHAFPDAQIVLNLQGSGPAPLPPEQALQQIIRSFSPGAQLPENLPALEALYRAQLHAKRVLILADDARDAAQVRPLLPPPGSALLITSRQRFALDGMAVLSLERLPEEAAVRLLRGICGRLTPEQAGRMAALCGRLPLALRVGGGILHNDPALPPERYLARLADRRLASLRDPDDPARDVEAALLLSYAALDAPDQAIFRWLGVLATDADLSLAAAVLGLAEEAADQALRRLLRRSLVEYDPARERWGLHELVRAYALGLLAEADEEREPASAAWLGDGPARVGRVRALAQTARQPPRAVSGCAGAAPEGGEALTRREIEVLRLLAAGATNRTIAQRLTISPHTVKRHIANVLAKLAASSRTEAAMRARDLGLL